MIRYFTYPILFITIFSTACAFEKPKVIKAEKIPKDHTIPAIVTRNFITKSHVLLLGRKPTETELEKWTFFLEKESLSHSSRNTMLSELIQNPNYLQVLYANAYTALLNFIFDPDNLKETLDIWRGYEPTPENLAEIKRLVLLDCIPHDLEMGTLTTRHLHQRVAYNSFYDFANMGTENFVVSMFQNFLHRYPTTYELQQGKKMVDGHSAILFRMQGHSKSDFVQIFFEATAYFEGQVRHLFQQYLLREPTSDEMAQFTIQFQKTNDYQALQCQILAMDEFVGI